MRGRYARVQRRKSVRVKETRAAPRYLPRGFDQSSGAFIRFSDSQKVKTSGKLPALNQAVRCTGQKPQACICGSRIKCRSPATTGLAPALRAKNTTTLPGPIFAAGRQPEKTQARVRPPTALDKSTVEEDTRERKLAGTDSLHQKFEPSFALVFKRHEH